MKLFLKPTAIFACIALLFCACGDDETEDLSYTLAPVTLADPVDVTVASGNGRAAVTWRVPDDGSITHAMIQWDNADDEAGLAANLNEITRVKVVPSVKETYYIGEVGELLSRNHNFKVTHIRVNSNGTITDRSKTVEVNGFFIYNNSTYENSLPNPYSVSTSGVSTANIYWSRFDKDLYSVKLSYTNTSGKVIDKTDDFFITEDEPTITLDDVKMDTEFSFYSYFLPEGGLDVVEIAPVGTPLEMASSAASPTSVSVVPGLGRMRVRWMIPTNESIVSSIVKYKRVADNSGNPVNGKEVKLQYGGNRIMGMNYYYDEDVLINNRNERFVSGDSTTPSGNSDDTNGGLWASIRPLTYLPSGYYDVSVINVKANGKYSAAIEEDGTLQTIHVYGYDSFVHATLSGVPIRDITGLVKFDFIENLTWNNATSVCTGITMNYTDADGNAQSKTESLNYFAETGLPETKVASTFTYETHFSPGLDDLTLKAAAVGDNSFIPDVAPKSPKSVTAKAGVLEVSDSGNFENQTPIIHVAWTPDEDAAADGIKNYRIYWYAVSGEVYKTDYLSVDMLEKNEDGDYVYTITDNLVSDTKYYVEIVSASDELEGLNGRTESEKIEVFDRPVTYSYDTFKDAALEWGAVKNNGYLASIVWSSIPSDCVGVAVLYNKANTPDTRFPEDGYSELSATISTTPLESAIVGEPFKYIVYHKPSSGVEPVKVWSTDTQTGVIPEPVPVPVISSAVTGYTATQSEEDETITIYDSFITLEWSALSDIDRVVDKMFVRYTTSTGLTEDIRVSLAATTLTLTTEANGIEPDVTYEFQIVTEDVDEQDYTGSNLTSESLASKVKTYNALSYSVANLPIATAVIQSDINFTWTNVHEDIKTLELTYADVTKSYTRDQLVEGFSIAYNSKCDQKFAYTVVFCPAGGETDIIVTGGTGMALMPPSVSSDYVVAGDTWLIYTAQGLKDFATQVNNTSSSRGLNAKIMNDIDMSAVSGPSEFTGSWTPIGTTTTTAYSGKFDGNKKKIVGLYVNTTVSYSGLFGCINGATIKDVILEDPRITSTKAHLAAITGQTTSSTIEGCVVQGANGYIYNGAAGGVNTGSIAGTTVGSNIINCTNYVNVSSGVDGLLKGTNIGGIVGAIATSASNLIGCHNAGDVTSGANTTGGIAGVGAALNSVLLGCQSSGVVTCGAYVANLVGYVKQDMKFIGCYNTGGVVAVSQFCGFIMGRFDNKIIDIIGCCNAGYVYNARALHYNCFAGNITGGCSGFTQAQAANFADAHIYGYYPVNQTVKDCVYVAPTDVISSTVVSTVLPSYRCHDNAFGIPCISKNVTNAAGEIVESGIILEDGVYNWSPLHAFQNKEGVVTRVDSYTTLNNEVVTLNQAIADSGIESTLGYSCRFIPGVIQFTDLPTLEVVAIK